MPNTQLSFLFLSTRSLGGPSVPNFESASHRTSFTSSLFDFVISCPISRIPVASLDRGVNKLASPIKPQSQVSKYFENFSKTNSTTSTSHSTICLNRGVDKFSSPNIRKSDPYCPISQTGGEQGGGASLGATKISQKRGGIMSTDLLKMESVRDMARKYGQYKSYLDPAKGALTFVKATKRAQ